MSAADQPPTLPNTEGWVRREPGDVIEAGTRVAIHWPSRDEWAVQTLTERRILDESYAIHWTPPPAPSEPWSVISTDRDKPTLARVRLDYGHDGDVIIGEWWRDTTGRVYLLGNDEPEPAEIVTDVELLHSHNPETHVPVERALIDEAIHHLKSACDEGCPTATALASLASDESEADR